ncbi:MAG: hypothetical protein KGR98_07265 [Verrucomicrobia bacterium]|nr:hypothetical protein [Verrucomicrobiota bacterium]MDE3098965.1 hypothetical protein [Verrucomicrobiota bacterium]
MKSVVSRSFDAARLALALAAASLWMSARAQLTTVAYDGFNYSAGALAGDNGGTGWSNAWTWSYSPGASLGVSATGLNYSGLSTTGGSAVWASGGNGISEADRSLPLQDGGIVYLQFLCQFGSSSGGGTPNIRLLDGTTVTGGFGANGGTYAGVISILNSALNPAVDGSSSSTNLLSSLNLVIGRMDYQNNTTMMWVNPDLSTFNYAAPPTPDATLTNAPIFDGIAIYTRSPGNVDEIKVMTEPVPEPPFFSLIAAAGILLLFRRRR